jgi:cation transport protein ChaC
VVPTRDALKNGIVHRRIAELATSVRVLSGTELKTSLEETLAGVDLSNGVWLFGYGSLIWNPAVHFTKRLIGRVYGHDRRFCLWSYWARGCRELPGLVLGLEQGDSCQGVAYHIASEAVREEMAIVWQREMACGDYLPRWVDVQTALGKVRAIAFVINHEHENYARDLTEDLTVDAIATGEGDFGPCADYLINTVDHLAALGIHDVSLERLKARVIERQLVSQPTIPPQPVQHVGHQRPWNSHLVHLRVPNRRRISHRPIPPKAAGKSRAARRRVGPGTFVGLSEEQSCGS